MATRFGLLLPHFGVEADQDLLIEGVQLAEKLGFDSIWVFDHMHTTPEPTDELTFEAYTTLAALAPQTCSVEAKPDESYSWLFEPRQAS